MGAPISGIGGDFKVSDVSVDDVGDWSATLEGGTKEYGSSSTAGYTKTVAGRKRWSGNIRIFLNAGSPNITGIVEGALATVALHIDGTHKLSGNIRIDTIEYGVDIEGAEIVPATVNFTGDGPWSKT